MAQAPSRWCRDEHVCTPTCDRMYSVIGEWMAGERYDSDEHWYSVLSGRHLTGGRELDEISKIDKIIQKADL